MTAFDPFVRRIGTGDTRILALHCALAHSGAWSAISELLGSKYSIVAPDMPSHGKSPDWDRQTDLHDLVTGAALSALEGPAHVIGHSFGATVALRLAIEHPELVGSLTLIEPVLFAACQHSAPEEFAAYIKHAEPFADAWDREDWANAARAFTSTWGNGVRWEDMRQKTQARMIAQMPTVRASQEALIEDSADLLRPGGLEALSMPVLFLRGGQTMPIIAHIHAALMARIPQAREAVVDEAGHMLPITHPAETVGQLRAVIPGL